MRRDWRGVLEWRNDNLKLSTPSNEACKLYDASLTQFIGWYDDSSLGGIDTSLKKMMEADPDFVVGRALAVGLNLLSSGRTVRRDKQLANNVLELQSMAGKAVNLTPREKKHVDAVVKWADGDLYSAALVWEDILLEHPTDIHALKMANDTYFYLGCQSELRDSVARCMPFWGSRAIPLKSYLHGMWAFGLQETNMYAKAEKEAKKGLERNQNDGWATHALAHVLEMEGRPEEGIAFLSRTVRDWETCNHLASHNYWHWALCHIERGEYDAASDLLETQVMKRAVNSQSMLDIVDSSSLLFRLQLTDPGPREDTQNWDQIYSMCKPHLEDHILGFNEAHFMMACMGSKNYASAAEILDTLGSNEQTIGGKAIVRPLLEAILAYGREKYDEAVDLLQGIRYQLLAVGGSNAQRDVFNQLLIVAAIKSPSELHRKLVEHLLIERESLKSNSSLTNRLILRLSSK